MTDALVTKGAHEWLREFSRERRAARANVATIYYRISDPRFAPKRLNIRKPYRPKPPRLRLPAATVELLLIAQGRRCYICHIKFSGLVSPTQDHVVPRSRGGREVENVLLACSECNNQKGDAMPKSRYLLYLAKINAKLTEVDEGPLQAKAS